jgi:hypothetical protein
MSLFQVDSVSQDNCAIEGEPWFRTVPVDKFVYRVIVRSLTAFRSQCVQYGRFRLFEIGKGKRSLGRFPLSPVLGHSAAASCAAFRQDAANSILGRHRRFMPTLSLVSE